MGFIDNALNGITNLNPIKLVQEVIGSEPKPEPKPELKPEQDTKSLSQEAVQQYNAYAAAPEAGQAVEELKETQLRNATGAAQQAAAQQAETFAQVPIAEAHEDIFDKCLNAEQQDAFRKLSPDGRNSFCKIYHGVGGEWTEQNQHSEAASNALKQLLEQGTLHSVDSNGKELVTTLGEACDKELVPQLKALGLDRPGQLQQIVKQLANPDAIYQGEGTDTCAPSTVQDIMASTQPGEFARISTELLFKGTAMVGEPSGEQKEIHLSFREMNKQDEGRSYFSRLMQGSLMDFASAFQAQGEEFGGRGRSGGTYRGNGDQGGLTANQIKEMYRFVIGDAPTTIQVNAKNGTKTLSSLSKALEAGINVPGGLDFDGQGHAVTIKGYDGENVVFADSVDRKTVKMNKEEFLARAKMVILPEQFASGFNAFQSSDEDFGGRGRSGGTAR